MPPSLPPRREVRSLESALAAEVMRSMEDGEPKFRPEIDFPLAEVQRKGRLSDRRLVARRAWRFLESDDSPISPAALRRALQSIRAAQLGFFLFVGLSALGICGASLLAVHSAREVSIKGFIGFTAFQVLTMLPPLLLLLTFFLSRRRSEGGIFSYLSAGLTVSGWLLGGMVRYVSARLRKESQQEGDVGQRAKAIDDLKTFVLDHPRPLSMAVATTSNIAWLITCVMVLCVAGWTVVWERFDYTWQGSLLSDADKQWWLGTIVAPLSPILDAPTEEQVAWLSGGQEALLEAGHVPAGEGTLDERAAIHSRDIRAYWTRYLLALPFFYGLLPRVMLTVLLGVLFHVSRRDLRPDLSDDYYRQLLEMLRAGPPVPDDDDDDIAAGNEPSAEEASDLDAAEVVIAAPPAVEHAPVADDARPERTGQGQTIIFSYEVPPPGKGWIGALEFPVPKSRIAASLQEASSDAEDTGDIVDLGNVDGFADRQRVLTTLDEQGTRVDRLLVIASSLETPDQAFGRFTRKLWQRLPKDTQGLLLLTDGHLLREKFAGDAEKVAQHVAMWQSQGRKAGIPADCVRQFDHRSATRDSIRQLHHWLESQLGLNQHQGGGGSAKAGGSIHVAGRFNKAAELLRRELKSLPSDPEAAQRHTAQVHRQLQELYAEQSRKFWQSLPGVDAEKLEQTARSVAEQTGTAIDTAAASKWVGSLKAFSSFASGLSPAWAAAAGATGAIVLSTATVASATALPVAAIPALFAATVQNGLVGGAVAGALGGYLPEMTRRLLGMKRAEESEAASSELQQPSPFDAAARSSLLWALVLELQGNAEQQIAEALGTLLAGISADPWYEMAELEAALATILSRIERFPRWEGS